MYKSTYVVPTLIWLEAVTYVRRRAQYACAQSQSNGNGACAMACPATIPAPHPRRQYTVARHAALLARRPSAPRRRRPRAASAVATHYESNNAGLQNVCAHLVHRAPQPLLVASGSWTSERQVAIRCSEQGTIGWEGPSWAGEDERHRRKSRRRYISKQSATGVATSILRRPRLA